MPYKSEKIRLPKEYDRRVKLSDEQKKEIREEYSLGKTSHNKLALKYKVSKSLIGVIVNEKRMENMKNYIKIHWKEHQQKGEEHNEAIKRTRRYKHELYKKGLI